MFRCGNRYPQVLQMSGETVCVKRIERPYIREKLIELGLNLQGCAAILTERICQPIKRKDEAFRALTEQLIRSSLRGEFNVCGGQGDE